MKYFLFFSITFLVPTFFNQKQKPFSILGKKLILLKLSTKLKKKWKNNAKD